MDKAKKMKLIGQHINIEQVFGSTTLHINIPRLDNERLFFG